MTTFSAAVVGLGNIGQGYDYESEDLVLTHARAYSRHPGFELVGAVDTDAVRRNRFQFQYDKPAFVSIAEMLAHVRPSVVSLAVPTPAHARVFAEILDARPAAILCEKPLAGTLEEARAMLAGARAARCVVAVNYVRRSDPGLIELKLAIDKGCFGRIYKGVAWYTKGLRKNGTHLVDLLRLLLGEASDVSVLKGGPETNTPEPDREPDFRVRYGEAEVYFFAARAECFSHFRIDLLATGGQIEYAGGGAEIRARTVRDDPVFSEYRQLDPVARNFATDMGRYQWHAHDSLYRHLTTGSALHSDGESAMATQKLIENIINLCEPA